jgi:O-antigen ligase
MGYALFILTNAALFLRPGDVVPALEEVSVYQAVILACLAVSFPRILPHVTPGGPARHPITACVLGFWAFVTLSQLARLNVGEGYLQATEFGKTVLYYLLLVSLVDTPGRLKGLLRWLTCFIALSAGLAVLHYHGYFDVPGLRTHQERWADSETGDVGTIPRMCGAGIFNDPNDLCLILSMGTLISLHSAGDRGQGRARFLWLAPAVFFVYAMTLTQSRGGFLGLAAGVLVLMYSRLGWRAVFLVGLVAPALLLLGSRQTSVDLSDKEDTGHARIELWAEGFAVLRDSPVLGIGAGAYQDEVGMVAHNSFVHAFVELGFAGGALFAGAFYLAWWPLVRLKGVRGQLDDPEAARPLPLVTALVTAYVVGILSLSRNYVAPTYLVLGLAAAYLRLAGPPAVLPVTRTGLGLAGRVGLVGACTLGTLYLATRLLV